MTLPLNDPFRTDTLLERFTMTWWGYGSPTARGWITGMEEGGGTTWDDVHRHLTGWENAGARAFVDLRPNPVPPDHPAFGERPKLVRHWARASRIALAATGRPVTDSTIRQYQLTELAAPDGDTCMLELLPLPSPTMSPRIYADHSRLSWLADRRRYTERMMPPPGIAALRDLIAAPPAGLDGLHRPLLHRPMERGDGRLGTPLARPTPHHQRHRHVGDAPSRGSRHHQ